MGYIMREYKAPVNDFMQILNAFHTEDSIYDRETIKEILESSARWVEKELVPSNVFGDRGGAQI